MNNYPIGVFDSGIGGLSIARRIHELLPRENMIYVADTFYSPYGDKQEVEIAQRAEQIAQFLMSKDVKAMVLACNTATASTVELLRRKYQLPIIGIEPGVKPAVIKSKTGVIGVLATAQTINSAAFSTLTNFFSNKVKIEQQACPGLMEQVEKLDLQGEDTVRLLEKYVKPLLEKGVDHIVLGCTHYAFLAPLIKSITGNDVEIVNTDVAVAREVQRRLTTDDLLAGDNVGGVSECWTSGDKDLVERQFKTLIGDSIRVMKMPLTIG